MQAGEQSSSSTAERTREVGDELLVREIGVLVGGRLRREGGGKKREARNSVCRLNLVCESSAEDLLVDVTALVHNFAEFQP